MTSAGARARLAFALAALLLGSLAPSVASGAPLVNWTTTNANPQGTNSVDQGQLVAGTANDMSLAWSFSFPSAVLAPGLNVTGQGSIAPPLVINGTVYVVMNDLEVIAFDAAKGSVLWTYTPTLNRTGLPLGSLAGHVHGLSFHAGAIWMSLPDCSAIALNSLTGEPVERITKICANIPGNAGKYDYSGAPLAFYHDLMIWTASSVSEGTDAGRGFVSAYDITTRALVWRWFLTPPSGGDPNWDTNSCSSPCHGNVPPYNGDWGTLGTTGGRSRAGGGPGWGQPAIDAADGIVILGTSQPSPDWNATYRPGPNLYSDSILALSLTDGQLVWFFQTTPHDIYDFDCGWNVAIANVTVSGSATTAAFKACKNGYVYAIDARTGNEIWKFDPPSLVRTNTHNADYASRGSYNATQPWVSTVPGYQQCPGVNGGIEADISVADGKVFVATHNFCAFITAGPVNSVGGSVSGAKGFQYSLLNANTTIYALDASNGAETWSYFLQGIPYRGWLTSTGGLVFASTLGGDILALDTSTGVLRGTTHVGSPLYEGITVGSDSSGDVFAFQLTSSPSYGAFTSAVPGSLLAFAPNRQPSYFAIWLVLAVTAGAATLALTYFALGRSRKSRGSLEVRSLPLANCFYGPLAPRGSLDRGQILGGVLGLVTLLSAFLLPLSSIAEGPGGSVDSFLAMFKLFITTLPAIERVGLTQLTDLAFVYMAAFILIVIAGIIGAYPRWSAVLGIASMAAVTFSPFFIFTSYNFGTSNYGVGFWAIWATTILAIYAAYWSRKERKKMKPAKSTDGGGPELPPPNPVGITK